MFLKRDQTVIDMSNFLKLDFFDLRRVVLTKKTLDFSDLRNVVPTKMTLDFFDLPNVLSRHLRELHRALSKSSNRRQKQKSNVTLKKLCSYAEKQALAEKIAFTPRQ